MKEGGNRKDKARGQKLGGEGGKGKWREGKMRRDEIMERMVHGPRNNLAVPPPPPLVSVWNTRHQVCSYLF